MKETRPKKKKGEKNKMKNKTKISMGTLLAAIILGSLFATMPVKAIIISHEFYDPLDNRDSSSFEYIGSTTHEPPPGWSVTGGGRGVWGDINDDGVVDIIDSTILATNWMQTVPPGDPRVDLNGDGIVGIGDATIIGMNWLKTKKSLEGDYAWHLGGYGDWYMTRYVDSYCLSACTSGCFVFSFWYLTDCSYDSDGGCRAEIALYDGGIYTYEGVWTVPIANNWTAVYVKCFVCSGESIQVKVHLKNIRAWVDCASGSIEEDVKKEDQYGSLALGFNMFSYKITTGPALDGEVIAVPTLYAQVASGYYIHWIELKVTNPLNEGTFNLNIPYCQQGNDKGYEVDPSAVEQRQQNAVTAAGIIVPTVFTAVLTFGVGAIGGSSLMAVGSRFAASTTFGMVIKFVLPFLASDPDHKTADGGGQVDAVWEHWSYPGIGVNESDFASSANAAYDLHWTFDTDTNEFFAVIIEAKVCFGQPFYDSYNHWWWLTDLATYTTQLSITIWV